MVCGFEVQLEEPETRAEDSRELLHRFELEMHRSEVLLEIRHAFHFSKLLFRVGLWHTQNRTRDSRAFCLRYDYRLLNLLGQLLLDEAELIHVESRVGAAESPRVL